MLNGVPGEWYADDQVGGYFDYDGHFIVCEEYGLTDEQSDRFAFEVMNGDGYYDELGHFVRTRHFYDD